MLVLNQNNIQIWNFSIFVINVTEKKRHIQIQNMIKTGNLIGKYPA
jgi:hypothetical protein